MQLVTQSLRRQLPPLHATERDPDPIVQCKFFTPDAQWTWFVLEFDGTDVFFGLVDGWCAELGYFALSELHAVRGALGLPVERDRFFDPQPLSAVKAQIDPQRLFC